MSRFVRGVVEWVRPDVVVPTTIPLLERGLRPNDILDEAPLVADVPAHPGDATFVGQHLVVTAPSGITWVGSGPTVDLDGSAGPVAALGDRALVAVDGRGLVAVDRSGSCEVVRDDPLLRQNVSALTADERGTVWACVASSRFAGTEWADALLAGDRTGSLVRVDAGGATVVVDGLAWPAGCEVGDGRVYVALSLEHRIEWRAIDEPGSSHPLVGPLPGYPGAIRRRGDRLVVAMPYLRNRMTELILSDGAVRDGMASSMPRETWLVPVPVSVGSVRDPLQFGQQRVMGVSKPWAPPRSYGLVIEVDSSGRVTQSWHSRHGGRRHGISGVAPAGERIVVVARGVGEVVEVAA